LTNPAVPSGLSGLNLDASVRFNRLLTDQSPLLDLINKLKIEKGTCEKQH